jgi:hypothetical protein
MSSGSAKESSITFHTFSCFIQDNNKRWILKIQPGMLLFLVLIFGLFDENFFRALLLGRSWFLVAFSVEFFK